MRHRHALIRRRRARGVLAAVALLATAISSVHEPRSATASSHTALRPDILVVVADDQAWSTFRRELMPETYRQVVDRGFLFDRAYVTTPQCCPSRSQLLTGLYGRHNGVDGNEAPLHRPTIAEALRAAGYRTVLAGKYLNSATCEPITTFDRWLCNHAGRPNSLVDPELNIDGDVVTLDGYTTDIAASYVAASVETAPSDVPVFAMYTPPSPHMPADDHRCDTLQVPPWRPTSYDEDTASADKPAYVRREALSDEARAELDSRFESMSRSVRCLDAGVATAVAAFEARGRPFAVVYTSDNGYLYGEHRRTDKLAPYEEAVRVPLAIRPPSTTVSRLGGVRTSALAANVDITATIAEWADVPWAADGRSLVPLLRGQTLSVRTSLLIEYCMAARWPCQGGAISYPADVPSYEAIVTRQYKYIEYVSGERELYDLLADPSELRNLAGSALYQAQQTALANDLDALVRPPAPATTLVSAAGLTGSRVVNLRYFSQSRLAGYRCRVSRDGAVGVWTSCPLQELTLGPLADGAYTVDVAASDESGATDTTPVTVTFAVGSSGPSVAIEGAPRALLQPGQTPLTFSSTGAAAFECRVRPVGGSAAWTRCASPFDADLDEGTWVFEVRGFDGAGRATEPPAARVLDVSRWGLTFLFDQAPLFVTDDRRASFAFHPTAAVTGAVECRVDAGATADCSDGTHVIGGLADGQHLLEVIGRDHLGRPGRRTFRWVVDATKPVVDLSVRVVGSGAATGDVRVSEPARLQCAFDDELRHRACSSPVEMTGLAPGPHRLSVIAMDDAGNVSAADAVEWQQP